MATTLTDTRLTTNFLDISNLYAEELRDLIDYREITVGGSYDSRLPSAEIGRICIWRITPAGGYYPTVYTPDDSGTYIILGQAETQTTFTTNGTSKTFRNIVYIGKFSNGPKSMFTGLNNVVILILFRLS